MEAPAARKWLEAIMGEEREREREREVRMKKKGVVRVKYPRSTLLTEILSVTF